MPLRVGLLNWVGFCLLHVSRSRNDRRVQPWAMVGQFQTFDIVLPIVDNQKLHTVCSEPDGPNGFA